MSEIHNYSVPLAEETMNALIKRFGLEGRRVHKEALTCAVTHALACRMATTAEGRVNDCESCLGLKGGEGCDDKQ